jgi:hypothetical protein
VAFHVLIWELVNKIVLEQRVTGGCNDTQRPVNVVVVVVVVVVAFRDRLEDGRVKHLLT